MCDFSLSLSPPDRFSFGNAVGNAVGRRWLRVFLAFDCGWCGLETGGRSVDKVRVRSVLTPAVQGDESLSQAQVKDHAERADSSVDRRRRVGAAVPGRVRFLAALEHVLVFDEGRPRVRRRRRAPLFPVNDPRGALLHRGRAHLMENPVDRARLGELRLRFAQFLRVRRAGARGRRLLLVL